MTRTCPKCGYQSDYFKVKFCRHWASYEPIYENRPGWFGRTRKVETGTNVTYREHLWVTCPTCGFSQEEACADAVKQ